jgi:hypothetical protein
MVTFLNEIELIVGDDIRRFLEDTIVQERLGIYDATKEEIDKLLSYRSNALLSDFTLADMISRRAQIGVTLFPSLLT